MDTITARFNFLKNMIYDPHVAALTMSSKYVVKKVLERLPNPLHTILEYGPGSGVMTNELLSRLSPGGELITIL